MIKLLGTYEYLGETIPAGAIVSVFDSATEAGLIAAKLALSSAGPTTWTPADRAYQPKTPVLFDAKTAQFVAQDERGIQALVSGAGNQPSATLAATTGTPGQVVKLSDGPDKGACLVWAIPDGRTTYTWCWQIYPLASYL